MRLSYTQEADFRKERDFGQKISATFEFLGSHWRPLGRVLLYLVVPAALLHGILGSILQLQMRDATLGVLQGPRSGAMTAQLAMFSNFAGSPLYWVNTVLSVLFASMMILSVYSYVVLCLRRTPADGEITVAEVWNELKGELLGTFFSLWGVTIIVVVGMAFLFLPGVYLGVALSLFFIVRMVEKTGFGATLSRCLSLTSGKWWSTFGLLVIMLLLVYMFMIGVGIISALLGGARAMLQAASTQSPTYLVVLSAFTSIVTLVLYPPLLLALAFQYFNLVERKEGVGLRLLVDSLGQGPAPQPSNAAYRADEEGEY